MKKSILLFFALLIHAFSCSAQWASGGTQLTFSDSADHKMFLSVDSHAGFYAAWMSLDNNTNNTAIGLGAYDSSGTVKPGWPVGGIIVSDSGNNFAPQIITSEDDGVIIAWYGYVAGHSYTHVFVQKYSAAGAALWSGGQPVQVTTGSNNNYKYPIIVSDRNNGIFLSFTRYDLAVTSTSPDILMQHIDNTGNAAAGWTAGGNAVAAMAGIRETNEQLVLTKDSNYIYVVYGTGISGAGTLVLNKFNVSDGSLASGWTSNGLLISSGPNVNPSTNHDLWIYADTAGNAVMFWAEKKLASQNGELYMSQVDPSGTFLVNGKYLAGNNSDGIDYLEVRENEDNNFLVTFNDLVIFNDVDAMMIKPNGQVIWYNSTVTADGNSAYPKPASDGKKGMFILYQVTNPPYTLHALALDSLGNMYNGWTLPGPNFGTLTVNVDFSSPDYQFDVKAGKPGEAIALWASIPHHIMSCNVWADGSLCTDQPLGVPENASPALNAVIYPNPFHDLATIYIDSKTKGRDLKLKLYDVSGRQVNEYILGSPGTYTISTAGLSQGIYFYRLLSSNEPLENGKLVKQ